MVCYDVWGFAMTFGAFAMMFRERQMISKIRTHLEIGFDSVCYDVLPNLHCKPKRHRKLSRTLTIEHDPGNHLSKRVQNTLRLPPTLATERGKGNAFECQWAQWSVTEGRAASNIPAKVRNRWKGENNYRKRGTFWHGLAPPPQGT